VDLRTAREFPAERRRTGRASTTTAEALTTSAGAPGVPSTPTKDVATTRRVARRLRASRRQTRRTGRREYRPVTALLRRVATSDGRLPLKLLADTVRHSEAADSPARRTGRLKRVEGEAEREYFAELWRTLTDKTPRQPSIRSAPAGAPQREGSAGPRAEIAARQAVMWQVDKIGSYMSNGRRGYEVKLSRQAPNDPQALKSLPLRMTIKPEPGESESYSVWPTHDIVLNKPTAVSCGTRPRFEARAGGRCCCATTTTTATLTNRWTIPPFRRQRESTWRRSSRRSTTARRMLDDLAKKPGIDAAVMKRWITGAGPRSPVEGR